MVVIASTDPWYCLQRKKVQAAWETTW